MNNVMTTSAPKSTYIQVRIRDDLKEDVQRTATSRGLTMSALIHSLLTQAVREEKGLYPDVFTDLPLDRLEVAKDKELKPISREGEMTDERKTKRKTG